MNNIANNPDYRVFVSYSHKDKWIVNKIVEELKSTGANVFIDSGGIEAGDDFREIIFSKLKDVHEILVLFTPSSVASSWVLAEVGAAIALETKRVIPLLYGVDYARLSEVGVATILGTKHSLNLDDSELNEYLAQLRKRVRGN